MIDPSHFLTLPSPVEKLALFGCSRLFIKRDDLINSIVSGNKWRKLSLCLEEAQEANKLHLVSFGGAFSNHLIALAFASKELGFECSAFVRGEELAHKPLNPLLKKCQELGMLLHFVKRKSYKDKVQLFNMAFGNNEQAFFIDEGGKSDLGIEGCREIIRELVSIPKHIVLAVGTGTTMAGICRELKSRKSTVLVHGICALKGYELNTEFNNYCEDGYSHAHVYHDGHFGGFAHTSPELLAFQEKIEMTSGILVDSTYNAKALRKLTELIEEETISTEDEILFLHTGGINLELEQ